MFLWVSRGVQSKACRKPSKAILGSYEGILFPWSQDPFQFDKVTMVTRIKMDSYHVEPSRSAAAFYNWFSSKLAATGAIPVLALYRYISTASTPCEKQYSSRVVELRYWLFFDHMEDYCNNLSGMGPQNLLFSQSFVFNVLPNFTDGIWLIIHIMTHFVLMFIKTIVWIKQN